MYYYPNFNYVAKNAAILFAFLLRISFFPRQPNSFYLWVDIVVKSSYFCHSLSLFLMLVFFLKISKVYRYLLLFLESITNHILVAACCALNVVIHFESIDIQRAYHPFKTHEYVCTYTHSRQLTWKGKDTQINIQIEYEECVCACV